MDGTIQIDFLLCYTMCNGQAYNALLYCIAIVQFSQCHKALTDNNYGWTHAERRVYASVHPSIEYDLSLSPTKAFKPANFNLNNLKKLTDEKYFILHI